MFNFFFENLALYGIIWKKNISDRICRENQNAFYVQFFFRKSCPLWDNLEKKYFTARYATDDNMTHVQFMLDN